MKAPLGRSFQSVLEELAEEMQKFKEMDRKESSLSSEVEKLEGNHVR